MKALSTIWRSFLAGAVAVFFAGQVFAQTPPYPTPDGGVVGGEVAECLNSTGKAIPIGSGCTSPLPVTIIGSTGAEISHASTTALGTSLVAKATAGNLYGYNCTAITGGAAGYCIAYNGTAAPATGALTGANVLDVCYFGSSPAGCSLSRIPLGATYSAGIVILVTSAATPFTYTTGTDTAFISADYQ